MIWCRCLGLEHDGNSATRFRASAMKHGLPFACCWSICSKGSASHTSLQLPFRCCSKPRGAVVIHQAEMVSKQINAIRKAHLPFAIRRGKGGLFIIRFQTIDDNQRLPLACEIPRTPFLIRELGVGSARCRLPRSAKSSATGCNAAAASHLAAERSRLKPVSQTKPGGWLCCTALLPVRRGDRAVCPTNDQRHKTANAHQQISLVIVVQSRHSRV